MSDSRLRRISFDDKGFVVDIPVLDETHFVSWRSIDTIIFGSEIIYKDHSEFIIYLNQPPVVELKQNPWWLNKLTFWMKSKNKKKIRISDAWNMDFSKIISNARLYLEDVKDVNINDDKRKGTLISRIEIKNNNGTAIKEQWQPERISDLKWEMVYDRHGRAVEDIYNRDKGR